MDDVREVLNSETPDRLGPRYPSVDFKYFFEMGLLEWVATEDENEQIFRVTEKAKKIFGNF